MYQDKYTIWDQAKSGSMERVAGDVLWASVGAVHEQDHLELDHTRDVNQLAKKDASLKARITMHP